MKLGWIPNLRSWANRRKGDPVRDFFGHEVEVNDRYFYSSPPTAGVVVKVNASSIMLDVGAAHRGAAYSMNCSSPEKGICIDKVEPGIS